MFTLLSDVQGQAIPFLLKGFQQLACEFVRVAGGYVPVAGDDLGEVGQ
jgi:hypothetical protein